MSSAAPRKTPARHQKRRPDGSCFACGGTPGFCCCGANRPMEDVPTVQKSGAASACDLGCAISCAPNGDCFRLDAAPQGIAPADRASMFIEWCALQGFGLRGWPEGAHAQLVAHMQEAARGR